MEGPVAGPTRSSTGGVIPNGRVARAKPQKTAVLLAQRIVNEIVDGGYEPGHMLPPERVMLAEYQVGRGTLREAMRFLEIQGVVAIKPGPGGGPLVTVPDSRHLASTVALLLQLFNTPFRAIVEARQVLEPAMAAKAAQRIDEERLAALAETVERMAVVVDDAKGFLTENERFHELIAWGSENDLFGLLVTALHWITDGTALGVEYPPTRRKAVLRAHRAIYEAVAARDARAAYDAMHAHMAEFAKYLEANHPALMDRTIPWGQVAV